jgi:cell wall assembly regulator SMI1
LGQRQIASAYHRRVRTWRRLLDALGSDAEKLALRKGASETAIVAAETLMNVRFPADYRAWLAIADGQEDDGLALFEPDARMLSLAQVMEAWVQNAQFVVEEWDDDPVTPEMLVRPCVWHPTRIPIAADYLGHGPFLDLLPGPAGVIGQLIQLVSECDYEVIATSLDDYFSADQLERAGTA